MKLKKIEIKNFRSIKEVVIEPENDCTVFVGKNEAGKSNLLKANIETVGLNKAVEIFSSYSTKYISKNLPKVILWQYDEKYLLPRVC